MKPFWKPFFHRRHIFPSAQRPAKWGASAQRPARLLPCVPSDFWASPAGNLRKTKTRHSSLVISHQWEVDGGWHLLTYISYVHYDPLWFMRIQDFAWHWRKSNCRWPSTHQHEPFKMQRWCCWCFWGPLSESFCGLRPARRIEVSSVVDFRNQEFLDQKWVHEESVQDIACRNLLQHVAPVGPFRFFCYKIELLLCIFSKTSHETVGCFRCLKRPVLAGPGEIPSACATQAFPHCQDLLSFHSFHSFHSCTESTIWLFVT